jgi:alkylation response protein AidB-like acyl-CoA dehydrogenase
MEPLRENKLMAMPSALDQRECAFLRQVAEFCRLHVDPACEQWEKDEFLPGAIFTQAGSIGLMGMMVSPALGGLGLSFVAYVQVIIELARHHAALALDIATHNSLCIGHILAFGSKEKQQCYVPRLASAEWLAAWALTEPHAGSDCGGMETTAVETQTGWELTGHKMFITQGRRADILIVLARTGTHADGQKELSAFLVHKEQVEGVRKIPTYGMKASDTAEIRFNRAKAELLGERGHGRRQALTLLDRGRIGIAALAVGIAQAAFNTARHHAIHREQFGHAIADLQAIQWMLADSATDLEAAELLTLRAASMQDQGLKTSKESAMAKLFASEAATRVCNRALQIHGGYGYSRELPLERYLRDVKLCEIAEGTSEIQRLVIARQLLKEVSYRSTAST